MGANGFSTSPLLHIPTWRRRADLPHGRILNIGECFPDGSRRLVRDVPVGSAVWNQLYHQARNASESRNATCEHLDLKRLPVNGQLRVKALIFLADTWSNLLTMARHTAALGGNDN